MALLTNQVMASSGTAVTLSQAADCTVNISDGRTFLIVANASGSSVNVTITTPGTVDGNAIADLVVAVAAGATKYIGVLNPAVYASAGIATVTFSATTSVTSAAVSV